MRATLLTMALLLVLGASTMIHPGRSYLYNARPGPTRQYYHVEHHRPSGKSFGFMKKATPYSPIPQTSCYYDNYPPYYGHPVRPVEQTYYPYPHQSACPRYGGGSLCPGAPRTVSKYPPVSTIASGQLSSQPKRPPTQASRPPSGGRPQPQPQGRPSSAPSSRPSPAPQPQPKPTYNNQVQGRGNDYQGVNNVIQGDCNTLRGDSNKLKGHKNVVVGDQNSCCGVQNCLCGDKNNVSGCRNRVKGESNQVQGGSNSVKGSDNKVNGCSNSVKGGNNCVDGSENKVFQSSKDIKNVPKITRSSYQRSRSSNNGGSGSSSHQRRSC